MKRRDIGLVMVVAVASFGVCMALAYPQALVAEDPVTLTEALAPPPLTLTAEGCELTLVTPQTTEAGAKPALTLKVHNTTDRDIELKPRVYMYSMVEVSPGARMMPMPQEVWCDEVPVLIGAGETRSVEVAPAVALAAKHVASFAIALGDQHVGARGLRLAQLQVQPAQVNTAQVQPLELQVQELVQPEAPAAQ